MNLRLLDARLLDASVLLASEDQDDERHEDATWLLSCADPLATLDLAFYEVTNVAVRAWRDLAAARRLRERVEALIDKLRSLPHGGGRAIWG